MNKRLAKIAFLGGLAGGRQGAQKPLMPSSIFRHPSARLASRSQSKYIVVMVGHTLKRVDFAEHRDNRFVAFLD
jgi:hypothetical protein